MASLLATRPIVDPGLASLFASSLGPVKAPKPVPKKENPARPVTREEQDASDTGSSGQTPQLQDDEETNEDEFTVDDEIDDRPRKRLRTDSDDLEATYFRKLDEQEEREQRERLSTNLHALGDHVRSSSESVASELAVLEGVEPVPLHESLKKSSHQPEEHKFARTIFLSNVSTDAIKSKSSRRTLLSHLQSVLKTSDGQDNGEKIESIRFRSTAYASDKGPKRATYAKQELMDQTTKSTNAYVVFSSSTAAATVVNKLNGSVVLDRHLRVDHSDTPSKPDHRRCVYVGNLPFVDEEKPVEQTDDNGNIRRARPKTPADAEEGLWRTFAKAGKVESVRMIRDKETRIGKGFAYVQFENENGVEAALLFNDKKYPPMLPRKLRVMRAKKTTEKRSAGAGGDGRRIPSQSLQQRQRQGSTEKRRSANADRNNMGSSSGKTFVFEGHRASDTTPKASRNKKRSTKPHNRSARRGAVFKASGGQKKRDR